MYVLQLQRLSTVCQTRESQSLGLEDIFFLFRNDMVKSWSSSVACCKGRHGMLHASHSSPPACCVLWSIPTCLLCDCLQFHDCDFYLCTGHWENFADESFTNCSKSKVLRLKFCDSLNYQPHTFLWRTFCKVKILRILPYCKIRKL